MYAFFISFNTSAYAAKVAMSDTHVFLLNEYFVELNTANFNILNKFLNWIVSKYLQMNKLLNWIL